MLELDWMIGYALTASSIQVSLHCELHLPTIRSSRLIAAALSSRACTGSDLVSAKMNKPFLEQLQPPNVTDEPYSPGPATAVLNHEADSTGTKDGPTLRILTLVHSLFFGGDETRVLAFSRSCDSSRFKHVVGCLHDPDHAYELRHGSMRPQFREAGVEVINLGARHHSVKPFSGRPDQVLRCMPSLAQLVGKVRQLVREHDIDIIDARLTPTIVIGSIVGRMCKVPVMGTTYSFEHAPSLVRRVLRQVSFALCNTIITDSEDWRSEFKRSILRPGLRVVNIPGGVFVPQSERVANEVRGELGVPIDPETRVICQVSRLVPYKGHATLLEAAALVLRKFPNAFFLVLGHDPTEQYQKELALQASRLGIADRVRISGYKGPIGDVWNIVDVHAHASHLDSSPNAILESMAAEKPAVVSDVGGIPDLVTHEHTGLVVPSRDADSLAQGILRVLENPREAREFAQAAKQRYLAQYTPQIMTRRLENLFLEMCNQRR